jgi:DNA polymerase-1
MAGPRKLVLIDGSSYLYRAFHALPPLTTSTGIPTGAVLGVINMLAKLIKEESPDLIAVVFDAPGRTFRDELFDQYKAHRQPMPDDLRSQVEPLLEAVEAMGLPMLRVGGVEADDVIGTLAARAAERGLAVLISTGDKDMAQLVNDRISIVNTMTGSRLDRAGVKAKFDVHPEQIVDYLALIGDASDNIPGVPRVGPKTAAKWLNEYRALANLVENADHITGKVGESLREHLTNLELSRRLATIDCAVPINVELDSLKAGEADTARLKALYAKLELRSLLRALGDADGSVPVPQHTDAAAPLPAAPATREYETIVSMAALERWIERLASASLIAFDTQTASLNYMTSELVGVSFSVEAGKAAYVPLAHADPAVETQLDRDAVLAALRPILEDAARPKVGHHLKCDAHVLAHHGMRLAGMRYDTMLESYVLNSTATRHDLDAVAFRYLGIETVRYETVAGKGAKQIGFDQVPVASAATYATGNADVTLRLHETLWPQICAEAALEQLYLSIEQPLVPVLFEMEHQGVLLDVEMLRRQSSELATRMREVETLAHAAADGPFNLDSPRQLQEVLFGRMGLPVLRKTPTGQPSTAEDVLEELAETYDLPRLITEYRALTKLRSTYTEKLPLQVDPRTGRVHTCYHQAVAATGRLSSTDPNLQNIPIRTAEGRRIRQAFIAPQGWCLLAADYSQIELRIMAHLSGDAGLTLAFAQDRDIHQATAGEVFGGDLAAVTADQRRSAKAINFGLIYGMSAFGLARQLGIERGAAQNYVNRYFERYPGVKRYMDTTRALARERGYVETVFGRRLYLPDIRSLNNAWRQYAERSAINEPMQGTEAVIIKRAMIAVQLWLAESRIPAGLILQVHDELVFAVRRDAAEELRSNVIARMSGAADLDVPLKVDAGTGANWDEAH